MAYDIVIGNSVKECRYLDSDFFIENNDHDLVFFGPATFMGMKKNENGWRYQEYHYLEDRSYLKKYRLFYRMADQYCDYIVFKNWEIPGLMKEMKILNKKTPCKNVRNFIKGFMMTCEKALSLKRDIFCFGD